MPLFEVGLDLPQVQQFAAAQARSNGNLNRTLAPSIRGVCQMSGQGLITNADQDFRIDDVGLTLDAVGSGGPTVAQQITWDHNGAPIAEMHAFDNGGMEIIADEYVGIESQSGGGARLTVGSGANDDEIALNGRVKFFDEAILQGDYWDWNRPVLSSFPPAPPDGIRLFLYDDGSGFNRPAYRRPSGDGPFWLDTGAVI